MTTPTNHDNEGRPSTSIDDLGHRAGAALRNQPADARFDSIKARGDRARRRATLTGVGIAAVAVVGGLMLVNRADQTDSGAADAPSAATATTPSPTTAAPATTTARATTTAPVATEVSTTTAISTVAASTLLDAAILPPEWFGMEESEWPLAQYTKEWASNVAECEPYLEFFDAPDVRSFGYHNPVNSGEGTMFVHVWPSSADAEVAVDVARSGGFDVCWAALHNDLLMRNTNGFFSAANYGPMPNPTLDLVGDESVSLGLAGPISAAGATFDDAAYTPIVRVGRAVFSINIAVVDLPPDKVQVAVEEAVKQLRSAGA